MDPGFMTTTTFKNKSLLDWARDACKYTRAKCWLRSPNRFAPGNSKPIPRSEEWQRRWPMDREERRKLAETSCAFLWKRHKATAGDLKSLLKMAEAAERLGAGNCFELSAVAFKYLMDRGISPLEIVVTPDPSKHSFVVLGLGRQVDTIVDAEVAHWGADVVVCDPWAKIWAPASGYESAWKARMEKWSAKEHLLLSGRDYQNDWMSPKEEMWFDAINKVGKRVLYSTG